MTKREPVKQGIPDYTCMEGEKLMTSEIKDILENMTTAAPEMEDYIGEDGLALLRKEQQYAERSLLPGG